MRSERGRFLSGICDKVSGISITTPSLSLPFSSPSSSSESELDESDESEESEESEESLSPLHPLFPAETVLDVRGWE